MQLDKQVFVQAPLIQPENLTEIEEKQRYPHLYRGFFQRLTPYFWKDFSKKDDQLYQINQIANGKKSKKQRNKLTGHVGEKESNQNLDGASG